MSLSKNNGTYCNVQRYPGERMEEVMGSGRIAPMHPWRDSLKYVVATLCGKLFPWCRVTKDDLLKVYEIMFGYINRNVSNPEERELFIAELDKMWSKLSQIMTENRGLWKLMVDSGARSLSFAKFPVDLVPRAIALESAFGRNYDNAGIYRNLLEVEDISFRSAAVEPEFVELRRRAYHARQNILKHLPELEKYREVPAKEKIGTIITVGAGLLIELRKFGMTLAQLQSLRIVACDMDESLRDELDVVFRHDFGVDFAETGIEYRFCSIQELLSDPELVGQANVFLMDGVLSYCQSVGQMKEYIEGAHKLCSLENSVIFCDLTTLDISLIRCAVVERWVAEDKNFAMHPEPSAKKAVKKMQKICRDLDFSVRHEIDSRNPHPLGVIFWIEDTLV